MSPETEEQFSKTKLSHVDATHSLHHAVLSLVATQSRYLILIYSPVLAQDIMEWKPG